MGKKTDDLFASTPQQELEAWGMDAEHAAAVVEHRAKTIKKPLIAMTARLIGREMAAAAKAGLVRDVNEAAEIMLSRCWRGFEVKWLQEMAATAARTAYRAPNPRHNAFDELEAFYRAHDQAEGGPGEPSQGLLRDLSERKVN